MYARRLAMLAVCCCLTWPTFASEISQPAEQTGPRRISYAHLEYLSINTRGLRDFRDNALMYDEAAEAMKEFARSLQGAELVWSVAVRQVTREEVLFTVEPAAQTRLAIVPAKDARQPGTFHARHINYTGPPSTLRYNVLSMPKTLRIGKDISLDLAKRLRKGDAIPVIGVVVGVVTKIPAEFIDDNVVYLANVRYFDEAAQP